MKHFFIIVIAFLVLPVFAGPVSHFGALKVCKINGKGQLCGEKTGNSTPIQVKGPSLFWHSSAEGAPFYVSETVDWFVDNMKIGAIRAAMGIRYLSQDQSCNNSGEISSSGTTVLGYYTASARETSKRMIKTVIDAAIINDIYVIVDWHSHNAHSSDEATLARDFFVEIANEYKDIPNIIWEVYNEPVCASTSQITSYSNTIINALRNAGNNNLVLVGSPSWSQQPNEQSQNWGGSNNATGSNNAVDKNVAFTFHFYAATSSHSGIMTNAKTAMGNGYAVFASEWGFSQADGAGGLNEATTWRNWMDHNDTLISNFNWNASAKNESSSMFSTGTTVANLLASSSATSRLTSSGNYFYQYMTGTSVKKWTDFIPSNHPKGNDVTVSVSDGESITLTSQLGLTGTVTEVSQPEEGTVTFTSNSVTYTTSPSGTQSERVRFTYDITQNGVTVKRRVVVDINNRKPYLPQKDPIAVSRKASTSLGAATTLSGTDPANLRLSFKSGEFSLSNPSMGTLAISGTNSDTLIFTPSASQHGVSSAEVTLNYTIQNTANAASSASVDLVLQNFAPTINQAVVTNCCAGQHANTEPVRIGMSEVNGRDRDEDSLWFVAYYLPDQYPGTLEQIKPDTLIYYPEANKTGSVIILSVVTDGTASSPIGRSVIRLTGSGTDIGSLPTPGLEIPGYTPSEDPSLTIGFVKTGELGLKALGFGGIALNFSQSGHAKLDVYSLSGKHVGNLLNGWQNAGYSEISIKTLNLQNGVYILRLRQGSQIKTLRIVN